jgi:hypothetical protein
MTVIADAVIGSFGDCFSQHGFDAAWRVGVTATRRHSQVDRGSISV